MIRMKDIVNHVWDRVMEEIQCICVIFCMSYH